MGWTESPPFFSAFTETGCDLANNALRRNERAPPHPLSEAACTSDFSTDDEHCDTYPPLVKTPKSFARQLYKQPVRYCDIFVDDYIGIGQDHPMNPIDNQRRTMKFEKKLTAYRLDEAASNRA